MGILAPTNSIQPFLSLTELRDAPSQGHVIAIHHSAERTSSPVVRRHELAPSQEEEFIVGIAGISSTGVNPQGDEALDSTVRRPIKRAVRRLDDTGQFLTTGALRSAGRALSIKTRVHTEDIFVRARFGQNAHDIHLRGARSLRGNIDSYSEVSIHSGMCLFSDLAARFWDARGRTMSMLKHLACGPTSPFVDIETDPELSFYEFITLQHLPRLIADAVDSLPERVSRSVTVDVPQVQYYGYLLEALRSGMVTKELALRWFDLVDQRHLRLRALFSSRLKSELSRVGQHGCPVELSPPPSLAMLATLIRDRVQRGVVPSVDELVTRLLRTGDPVWTLLAQHEPLNTIVQINEACNIVEILRGTGIGEEGSESLAIVVDNYQEFPRREHVQRLLDSAAGRGRRTVLGIYAIEQIMNVDSDGYATTPYLLDPGRFVRDHAGKIVDLFQYVEALYGHSLPRGHLALTGQRHPFSERL